jgi:tetrahydromethanopterin S-methyltransferase subunit C
MRRFAVGLVGAVGGYAFGAFSGYFLIHVFGPLGAVAGFVVGFVLDGRRARRRQLAGPEAK